MAVCAVDFRVGLGALMGVSSGNGNGAAAAGSKELDDDSSAWPWRMACRTGRGSQ